MALEISFIRPIKQGIESFKDVVTPRVTLFLSQHYDEGEPQWGGAQESGGIIFAKAKMKKVAEGKFITESIIFNSEYFNLDNELVRIYEEEGAKIFFSQTDTLATELFPS